VRGSRGSCRCFFPWINVRPQLGSAYAGDPFDLKNPVDRNPSGSPVANDLWAYLKEVG